MPCLSPPEQDKDHVKSRQAARGVAMLDLFYVAIVVAFFVLLWGFTRASERL